ncbi:MAG: hypothetical protein ABI425_03545 [Patescibacteria group bacterium]
MVQKNKAATLTFTLVFLTMFGMQPVHAQKADLNIGISPPLTHIIIQPGKSALTTVSLENQGNFDVNLTTNFVDFTSDNKTGIPVLSDNMSFSYMSLQDAEVHLNTPFLLKTGNTKQLVFEVALPENSVEKEYHFSLVTDVEPIQNSLHDQSGTAVSGQIVSNFIITVSRTAKDQGIIELQSFEAPLFLDSLSAITAKVFMHNAGKNTTVTLGNLRIVNVLGNVVYENDFLPENILPGAGRQVFGSESVNKDGEEYKIEQPIRYKGLFLLGPYKLILTYHAPGQEEQKFEHTVFALPISALIFVILVYIVYLLYTKSNLFQGRSRKAKPENGTQHKLDS